MEITYTTSLQLHVGVWGAEVTANGLEEEENSTDSAELIIIVGLS